jgi:hypothetical protein
MQNSRAKNWIRRHHKIASRFSDNYRELIDNHTSEMENMRQAFSTDMRLRASEKFWSHKRRLNRKRGRSAFKLLCWVGGLGAIILGGVYYLEYRLFGFPEGFSFGHTILYIIPALLFVWLLRILANEYRTNQQLADDAEEREAMVLTFKALEFEEHVGDEERLIILNALFRPHIKGAEENVPIPIWEAIIGKSIKAE